MRRVLSKSAFACDKSLIVLKGPKVVDRTLNSND